MKRNVVGLKWAKRCERPSCVPNGGLRGVRGRKREGIKFERNFAAAMGRREPEAEFGVWFEFEDTNGRGFCEVDGLTDVRGAPTVMECKLSRVDEGLEELKGLYLPIVHAALGVRPRGVIVAKYVSRRKCPAVVVSSWDGVRQELRVPGAVPVLHWLDGVGARTIL